MTSDELRLWGDKVRARTATLLKASKRALDSAEIIGVVCPRIITKRKDQTVERPRYPRLHK